MSTVIAAVAMIALPQFIALPAGLALAWVVVTFIACCASHVVVHNHCHHPIFDVHAANRAFNLVATLARGHCASDVVLAHNLNHHVEQGRARDWIAPALGGAGHPLLRLLRFVPRAAIRMVRERAALGAAGRALVPEPFRSSLRYEKILLPVAVVALALNDWRHALLYAGVPWAASLAWLVGVNYVQHESCDPDSAFAHSRNFTGRLTNWLLFNNGYHTAHHLAPELHWSALPQLHARIERDIPAALAEPSATRYMLRRYLRNFGQQRLRATARS